MSSRAFSVKTWLRISGARHAALDTARGRIVMISAVFALCYILVAVRVFDLAVVQGKGRAADHGQMVTAAPAAETYRADIVDRNGVLLATSLDTASLYADPALITAPADVAAELTALFPELVYGEILQKLQQKGRFVWIRRSLTPDEQFRVLRLGRPGLGFRQEQRRIYPQGNLAAHIAGYGNVDQRGLAGIERSFDNLLQRGDEMPLTLTLDVRVQHILRRELQRAVDTFSAIGGAGAVVDIASGEIVAAVSLPDFDPHNPGAASDTARFNRLTLGVYELGSTFKIFSTAALLELRDVPMDFAFDAREPLKRGRFTIADYHAEERILTVPEVFMFSSNIGSALMGEMVGTEALRHFYEDLGLADPLALEIEEIGKPLLPPVWRDINTLTASYGHGIAVTPLQMVMAAASIVNGGIRVQPTLVLDRNKAEMPQNKTDLRIVSPQTAHRMRQLMRLTVTDGTGSMAAAPGYVVGGKTGTAEKIGPRGYDKSRLISSFLGFFPMDAPRYAVFAMVDEPRGTKESFGYATGGWVAAPVVGRVITAAAPLLGVKPRKEGGADDIASSLKQYVSFKSEEGDALAAE